MALLKSRVNIDGEGIAILREVLAALADDDRGNHRDRIAVLEGVIAHIHKARDRMCDGGGDDSWWYGGLIDEALGDE